MNFHPRLAAAGLLALSMAAGSLSETQHRHPARFAAGYRVLAADFHVHSFPLSWGALSPFDTVLEARREGLDAIAMAGHNHVWVSQVGRWFSGRIGGPTVLPAEEIVGPAFHMVAVGIGRTVGWRQTAAGAIDEIHRQGGVAIAAHPVAKFWPAYDPEAMRRLDAAEVMNPIVFGHPRAALEMRQFLARRRLTAIGSSDFHAMGPIGLCRTYVFVTENTERGILEALRQGHTVVFDLDGQPHGDPELIRLAAVSPEAPPHKGFWHLFSGIAGLLGLLMGTVAGPGGRR